MMNRKFLSVFIFFFLPYNSFCQIISKSIINYNVRINSFYDFQIKPNYNYRSFQIAPVFSLEYKNHNVYLGPLYVYLFQPKPVANEVFDNNAFGLNLGYRYYSKELFKNGRLFGQLNYSIFNFSYQQHQSIPPFQTKRNKVIAQNTISLGLDYKVINRIHLFVDFGLGSLGPFFLLFNRFTLTSNIGIELDFNK